MTKWKAICRVTTVLLGSLSGPMMSETRAPIPASHG